MRNLIKRKGCKAVLIWLAFDIGTDVAFYGYAAYSWYFN
jgi:hypothetical protein